MDLDTIRKNAPPLFVARATGARAPAVRAVNPAAAAYLTANGAHAASLVPPVTFMWIITVSSDDPMPLDAVYPDDAASLRKMAPSLTTLGDQALNPSALAFAMASGLPLEWVYPEPPSATSPAALDYVKRIGKAFEDVYPTDDDEALRWQHVAATAAGLIGGALVAGPVGIALPVAAIAGATFGGAADFVEWKRKRRAA